MDSIVGIPVYNEERYVAGVMREVKRYAEHIVVVNDGSTDGTAELLRQAGVDVLAHPKKLGYGASLIDIFKHAEQCHYEYAITMDCDEQHEPQKIPDFIAAVDGVDIVSGSRYMAKSQTQGTPPSDRQSINRKITAIINELTGYELTDSFCGFKAYRVDALRHLRLTERGYGMPLQLWLQAAKNCLTVREIPVKLIYGDASRGFGSGLDNAAARLNYYMQVIERETCTPAASPCCCNGGKCCCEKCE